MWIQTTAKGFRMYERYTGTDGKQHKASIPLEKNTPQARKKAHKELLEIISEKSAIGSDTLLKRLIDDYMKHKDIKPSTRQNYEFAFDQILKCTGNINISELTAPYIMRRFSESQKNQITINRYIMIFNSLLEWAYQYGYMSEHIKLKPGKEKEVKRDPEMEYLEVSELQSVLDQLQGRMPYYVCKFLALTGCRIGEASALTLDDIDDKYIHITKAWKVENGISTPKTVHSVRDIYIQPELRIFLREYKQWRSIYQLSSGIRTDLLFFTNRGNVYAERNLSSVLSRIKCEKHLHPHIFRHTHVAILAEQGMSLEAIARRLGHSSSSITKKIYFHVTEKQKEKDEMALDKVQIL